MAMTQGRVEASGSGHRGSAGLIRAFRPSVMHVRPADIGSNVRRKGVQEALGADFVAHRTHFADIAPHRLQDGEMGHHGLLVVRKPLSHTPPASSLSAGCRQSECLQPKRRAASIARPRPTEPNRSERETRAPGKRDIAALSTAGTWTPPPARMTVSIASACMPA